MKICRDNLQRDLLRSAIIDACPGLHILIEDATMFFTIVLHILNLLLESLGDVV